jgi:hypothetical protein
MSRLTIDISDQQHKSLKALSALEGKSIKQYALERLFPIADEDDEAWEEFKALINSRIEAAETQGYVNKTVTEIFDEELARDEAV